MSERQLKLLTESDGIKVGDIVKLKLNEMIGFVNSIIDYGTHIVFFIEFGLPLSFSARREWIELVESRTQNQSNKIENNNDDNGN